MTELGENLDTRLDDIMAALDLWKTFVDHGQRIEGLRRRLDVVEEKADHPLIQVKGPNFANYQEADDYFKARGYPESYLSCRHKPASRVAVQQISGGDWTSYEQCSDCGAHYGWHRLETQ